MTEEKRSPCLMEEMRVLAGVQPGGVIGIGLEEANAPARVRHKMDSNGNVVTPPSDVLASVLGGGGNKITKINDVRMTLDVKAPNVVEISAYLDYGGYMDHYRYLEISALNPGTNKVSVIKRFTFPKKVQYLGHTHSWWIGGDPSFSDDNGTRTAIDSTVKDARDFVSKYVKAAKKSEPKGEAGLLAKAQEINQRLNLRIPPNALKKLMAELKP